MLGHGTILDYASPRPRGGLRLPAKSELFLSRDDSGITITETLSGKPGAIAALVFGAAMMVPAAGNVIWAWRLALRGWQAFGWVTLVIALVVLISLIVVMILVIDQTWRKTTVRADHNGLWIAFRALMRSSQLHWPSQYVGDVRVIMTQDVRDAPQLGEIEIHLIDQPLVKLFTDHLHLKLQSIAEELRHTLRLEHADTSAPNGTNEHEL